MEPRPCPLHLRQKWERKFWPRHKRNPCWCHNADARHSLVGQDLPSYALLQRCESTSFTCCGFGGNNKSGTKAKQKWVMLSGQTGYYLWFPDVRTKEQGVGSFARAIGACIIPCEKAWHWFHHEIDPHIFMLRNRMNRRKIFTVCVLISFTSNEIQVRFRFQEKKTVGWRGWFWEGRIRKILETREYSRVLRTKHSKHHEEYCFPTSVEFPGQVLQATFFSLAF